MRKLWIGTICFLGLLCVGIASFVYIFQGAIKFNAAEYPSQLTHSFVVDGVEYGAPESYAQKSMTSPLQQNYANLPDLETTAQTKQFFESLYILGYLGQNEEFQRNLYHLTTEQILANLILSKNDRIFLKTSQLKTSMLRFKQLKAGIDFANKLLVDLNTMAQEYDCSADQKQLINLSMAHMIYLIKNFKIELDKFIITDPLLVKSMDPNNHNVDLVELKNKHLQYRQQLQKAKESYEQLNQI